MNPNSRIWLCKTNLENDYKNTLTFSSSANQRNYFIGNPADPTSHGVSTKMYSDYTYLRIENAIKVDDFIESIDTNNYLVLQNNNKYYYYFITSMDYIDEQTTKIYIELDVMQTYYFDITYNQTFVEREHVVDDTAGKHTIPEGLETGEYVCNSTYPLADDAPLNIVFQVIYDDTFPNLQYQYGGVFSGTCFIIFDISSAIKYIKAMDRENMRDYIVSIFMYKGNVASSETYQIIDIDYGTIEYKVVKPSSVEVEEYFQIMASKPTALGSYTPRNKKLLTYPYNCLLANNNVGGTKIYRYEDFSLNYITFKRISTICQGGSSYYMPTMYKVSDPEIGDGNLNEGFAGAKFPICSWNTDSYTNWLTQNSVNEKFNALSRVGQGLGGLALMGIGASSMNAPTLITGASMISGAITGGIGDIMSDLSEKEQHQIAPMELSGNASLGDVFWAYNRSEPVFYSMSIKEEYAKVIDKFFDMYGYQVNILKTPSIHTRRYWNYLKTKNCNFTGNIPQEYMERIKKIFDSGITFWHDPSKMLDYTQTNSVLT